jgi:uridine kinase
VLDGQPGSDPAGRTATPGEASSAALVVGIAGESDDGTRRLAGALTAALGAERVARLCHDAYRHDAVSEDIVEGAPPAIDHALLLEHMSALRAGRAVSPPSYSAVARRRTGHGPLVLPRRVLVVDGALLLWEPAVRAALDLSIYLDRAARGRTEPVTARSTLARWVERTRAMADLVLSNSGPIERVAEVATAVVLDRLARAGGTLARLAS